MLPPVFLINLDRSPERWMQAGRDISPLTEEVIRVPAVDGAKLPYEDVKKFHDGMRATVLLDRQNPPDEWIAGRFSHDGCASERTFKLHQKTWRGKYGCYLSHVYAIQEGIDSGAGRFIVMEDDAVPRLDILEALSLKPHARGEGLFIWGGALVMNDRAADETRYWRGLPFLEHPGWSRIAPTPRGIHRVFGTTAYELDRGSAERFLEILERRPPLVFDCAWWYAMLEIPSYRLRPGAFGTRWSDETSSTIGRNAPRIPLEKWIANGTRPADIALISPEYEDPKRWRGMN